MEDDAAVLPRGKSFRSNRRESFAELGLGWGADRSKTAEKSPMGNDGESYSCAKSRRDIDMGICDICLDQK